MRAICYVCPDLNDRDCKTFRSLSSLDSLLKRSVANQASLMLTYTLGNGCERKSLVLSELREWSQIRQGKRYRPSNGEDTVHVLIL